MSSIIDGKARRFGWALVAMVLAGCARTPLAKDPPQPQKEAEPAEPAEPAGPTEPAEPASPCKRAADARARVPDLLSAGWLDRSRRLLDWADRSCPEEATTSRALRERVTVELTDARSTSELIKAARAAEAAHHPAEMRRLYDLAMTRAEADSGERIVLDERAPMASGGHLPTWPATSWSPDSRTFAVAHGQAVSLLEHHTEFGAGFVETRRVGPWGVDIRALAFSPDGTILAVATNDETIRWIDTTTFREVRKLVHPAGPIAGTQLSEGSLDSLDQLEFSTDGRWFASKRGMGSPNYERFFAEPDSGSIMVWDAKSGARVCRIDTGTGRLGFGFSSKGDYVWANTLIEPERRRWDVPSGRLVDGKAPFDSRPDDERLQRARETWFKIHAGDIGVAWEFSPDGAWVVKDGEEILETSTGNAVSVPYPPYEVSGIDSASVSPAGTHLLSAGGLGTLVWSFGTPTSIRTLWTHGQEEEVAFAWTPDGGRYAFSSSGVTEVWTADGRRLASSAKGTAERLNFSPDGKALTIDLIGHGGVTSLPLEGPEHAKGKAKPAEHPRSETEHFPRAAPRVVGIENGRARLGFRSAARVTVRILDWTERGIATTPDGSAVELFGPDVELAGRTLRCTLGTRAFPFEFCRGRFERPGLVLDALSAEGEGIAP